MAWLLALALAVQPAIAVSKWTLWCERHLIGYDFHEDIDRIQASSANQTDFIDKLEEAYRVSAVKVYWNRADRYELHKLKWFGKYLKVLKPTSDQLYRYAHLEDIE